MGVAAMHAVTKRYRGTVALDDVSIDLAEHRIHGLLGRNGAGKTTLMQLLTAQNLPTSGRVELFGERPYENAAVLARTCFVREALKYPDQYRVRHALRAAAAVFPGWDQRFADDLAAEFELPLKQSCKKLSRGQLSAVGVVIGLASRAPLTFFDEPYLGLDAAARHLFYDRLLADYAEHPRTVVLSTHLIDEVSDLVEHVVVLDRGRVVIDADTDDLRGRAVTVSGPAEAVERFVAGHAELHREGLGAFLRVTVRGASPAAAEGAGLACEPVSLQQLVVSSTQRRPAGAENQEVLS